VQPVRFILVENSPITMVLINGNPPNSSISRYTALPSFSPYFVPPLKSISEMSADELGTFWDLKRFEKENAIIFIGLLVMISLIVRQLSAAICAIGSGSGAAEASFGAGVMVNAHRILCGSRCCGCFGR